MWTLNTKNIKLALDKYEDQMKTAITQAIKSSCTIKVSFKNETWTGSGFHIGNGYIGTVSHVAPSKLLNNDYSMTVTFDGATELKAKVIVSNASDDTAIIYAPQAASVPFVELGNSDTIEVGDIIAVIGAPEGWHDTATVGRVTNRNQNLGEYAPSPAWNNMIFIDADILEGASGGEVIATDGKVYGLVLGVTGYNADIGVGQNAVIPVNKLKKLINPTSNTNNYIS